MTFEITELMCPKDPPLNVQLNLNALAYLLGVSCFDDGCHNNVVKKKVIAIDWSRAGMESSIFALCGSLKCNFFFGKCFVHTDG